MVQGTLTIVIGGVRSGKSAFAERQLIDEAMTSGGRLVYIASGTATDSEMESRITRHQQDRSAFNWVTIEQPMQLEQLVSRIQPGDTILWDCVTTWLANEFYEGGETGVPCIQQDGCIERKIEKLYDTIEQLLCVAAHLSIVSNEVLDERPSPFTETQLYSKWLGEIYQTLVQMADTAIEMDTGIAVYHKGKGLIS